MSNNPGGRMTASGFAVMLIAVSAGVVGSGDFGLLLGLVGVLVGANVIAVGFRRMGREEPTTPPGPVASAGVGAFKAFLRRNLAGVGIILASFAVTAVAGGEAGPALCGGMFALFLLAISLTTVGVLGD